MFHHFPATSELKVKDYLVKSTDFSYGESPVASFIIKITQSGYLLKGGMYMKKSLPPLEFRYSPEEDDVPKDTGVIALGFEFNPSTIHDEIREIDAESLENLPVGLDGARYQWIDLDGEGLAGILTEQAGGWFYKHNLSSLPITGPDGKPIVVGRFEPLQVETFVPSFSNLNSDNGKQQLMDLSGDGKLNLVKLDKSLSGYFKRSSNDENWENFASFASLPNVNWNDANLRFIDLTGDGLADIMITEDQAFSWYPSLAEKGFGELVKKYIKPWMMKKVPG